MSRLKRMGVKHICNRQQTEPTIDASTMILFKFTIAFLFSFFAHLCSEKSGYDFFLLLFFVYYTRTLICYVNFQWKCTKQQNQIITIENCMPIRNCYLIVYLQMKQQILKHNIQNDVRSTRRKPSQT